MEEEYKTFFKQIYVSLDGLKNIKVKLTADKTLEQDGLKEIFYCVNTLLDVALDHMVEVILRPLRISKSVALIFNSSGLPKDIAVIERFLDSIIGFLDKLLEAVSEGEDFEADFQQDADRFANEMTLLKEDLRNSLTDAADQSDQNVKGAQSVKVPKKKKKTKKAKKTKKHIVLDDDEESDPLGAKKKESRKDYGKYSDQLEEPEVPEGAKEEKSEIALEDQPQDPSPGNKKRKKFVLSEEFVEAFVSDSTELLSLIEEHLLIVMQDLNNRPSTMEIYRLMHTLKGNCTIFKIASIKTIAHQSEEILELIVAGKKAPSIDFYQLLLKFVDEIRSSLEHFTATSSLKIENEKIYMEGLKIFLEGKELPDSGRLVKDVEKVENAAKAQSPEVVKTKKVERKQSKDELENIRVKVEKLDSLNNLLGELVTSKVMIEESVKSVLKHNPQIEKDLKYLDRVTSDLQSVSLDLRMIPSLVLFNRMARIIFDISQEVGKKVKYTFTGEDTEIDRLLMEKLTDPLVHLIRNSIDHGIEFPKERKKLGKPEIGEIKLEARSEAGDIWITVKDDGRGINEQKVFQKAVNLGLVKEGDKLSSSQIVDFIFSAGFSTSESVTDLSGRGIGMDIIRRNVEKIKGRMEIQNFEGKGTWVTMKIPLTLAIIQGMLLKVGEHLYTLPIENIVESINLDDEKISCTFDNYNFIKLREDVIPVISLRKHFRLGHDNDGHKADNKIVVVIEHGNSKIALLIDKIITMHETVIRPLPKYFSEVRGVTGCSILGNGETSLVLDPVTIIRDVEDEKGAADGQVFHHQ